LNEHDATAPDGAEEDWPTRPLRPRALTWAALLASWVEFAKATTALPDEGDAGLLKRSATDLITLQAVACALEEVDQLPREQQRIALDRAELLIDQSAGALTQRFAGGLPDGVQELIDDARARLAAADARTSPGNEPGSPDRDG